MNDSLDEILQALASPPRRAILARLVRGEATVNELVQPLGISQPAVSRHLRILEEAGLIVREPRAQQRVCRMRPEAWQVLWDWLSYYRGYWQDRFEELDRYLEADDEKS